MNEQTLLIDRLLAFVREIATGFDHDADAHRYNTFCRVCEAEKLLALPRPDHEGP